MYQFLEFDRPIPSCSIHSLKFDLGKWKYIYALNTPFELTNENKEELVVYEYISDLHLKLNESVHEESINLRITTLDEYLFLLEKQIEEDVKYREKWLLQHPDEQPNTLILENRDYSHEELLENNVNYISFIVDLGDEETIFAGI